MTDESSTWEIEGQSSDHWLVKGKYRVTWIEEIEAWDCTCPHFVYRRPWTCKHIEEVARREGQEIRVRGWPVWYQAVVRQAELLGNGYFPGQLVHYYVEGVWAIIFTGAAPDFRTVRRSEMREVIEPQGFSSRQQRTLREIYLGYLAGSAAARLVPFFLDGDASKLNKWERKRYGVS